MTYKERALETCRIRREIYMQSSEFERFRYMAEGLEAAECILRSIPDDEKQTGQSFWIKIDATLFWNASGLYAAGYKCGMCGSLSPCASKFCHECGRRMISVAGEV